MVSIWGATGTDSNARLRTAPAKIPAMISQDLFEALVCPICRKPLVLKDNPPALKCGVCRRVYLIKDDIPVMLIDEAKIDPS